MPIRTVEHGNMRASGGRTRMKMQPGQSGKSGTELMGHISFQKFPVVGLPSLEDPGRLYDSIVEIASILTNTARVSLMLPEHGVLRIKGAKGIDKDVARKIRIKPGAGISGKVFKEGEPMVVADVGKSLPAQKKPNYRTGSFVIVPLKLGEETVGVLNISDRIDGRAFSEDDVKFIRNLAYFASIAIRGAHCCSRLEELKTLSLTDSLTGLFNRRYFDERLHEELHRGTRYNSFFSLAILDIDDFKLFNDTEGHLAGDGVLKAITHIARESLRSIDVIARYGGEEFAIIMPETRKDEAFLVAERTRKNIEELMSGHWEKFPHKDITVSIGIASFPWDGKDAATLIRSSDKALYRAKVSGKNRTVVWGTGEPE
jgi:diguanylate cyclase (GGDEF)-like protein